MPGDKVYRLTTHWTHYRSYRDAGGAAYVVDDHAPGWRLLAPPTPPPAQMVPSYRVMFDTASGRLRTYRDYPCPAAFHGRPVVCGREYPYFVPIPFPRRLLRHYGTQWWIPYAPRRPGDPL